MDVTMPVLNGLKATQKLTKLQPNIKIVALTRHTDNGYLQQLLKAGASGYVLKQSSSAELLKAIRVVAGGEKYLDPAVTEKVIGSLTARNLNIEANKAGDSVTPRELEVLRLTAWGFSNKEIAAKLDVSVKTVEAHKTNAMRKLEMRSRIDIVRYASLQGWLDEI
jgi:DNA-binding NarL/FixJ family response regulator